MKIDELKNNWLNYLVGRGRCEGTRKDYSDEIDKFIKHLNSIGINDIQLVTTQIIEEYIFNSNVCTNTKAWKMIPIKGFFNFLLRRKYIEFNPASNLESIKTSQTRPEYLSQEQSTKLLNTIEKESTQFYKLRDLTLVKLLMKTGLRRAEVVSLNVEDIDFSKHMLRVKRKGNREEYVIMHDELIEDIRNYLKTIKGNPSEPLFLSKKGQRLSASSIWHIIKTYSKKAGLNDRVTVHSLRHTFATSLLSESMPLPYIQKLMGHRSPQTTSRYLHVQDNELTEAFNKVTFGERR